MFAQIINCDSSIEIFNTPYPLALSNVKFSLNDCEDIDYNIIRMGTPAFEKLQKRLNSSSIEQVLSLENQQTPITEENVITDLTPPERCKIT
ncbi:[weak similarity to] virulence plasmid 28.1 kDaA protein [Bathymodiolus azoricus thioautotrophic gill symbiont]|uniref:[weak similarity to] virulence plasmid 28.1 kDaA protein n=1 Tax=Bathymodiolus azoricus thioautotrophic gill symbiont TaxID=235205 RepID=A0A1H6K684_9GAMM|nr:[weak similarity to] virulence plasmid 28.1 kDaA protein [Bathymodiolus azoricus thioautotrophic gill symbiont]